MYYGITDPVCNKGRLYFMKNINDNSLYLQCESCQRIYTNPKKIDIENSFLSKDKLSNNVEATWDELEEKCWEDYALYKE